MRRSITAIIRETVLRHGFLWLVLLLAAVWKAVLLAQAVLPFNADEAIVALMARHILHGGFPLLFYGQAYMGSLDAILVAGGFAVFGQSVTVIRVVQCLLYLGTIAVWYRICWRGFHSLPVARLTALFLAVPPVLITLYTTVSLGGYGEAMLLGGCCISLAVDIRGGAAHPLRWLTLGLLAGLAFWSFPLSLVFSVPALCAVAFTHPASTAASSTRRTRATDILPTALGILIGATPWILAVVPLGATSLLELGGSAIAGSSQGSLLTIAGTRLLNLVVFGGTAVLGLRPPWSAEWLIPWLAPLALLVGLASVAYGFNALRKNDSGAYVRRMLAGVVLLLAAAYLLTPFGNDPSGRYFLPLFPVLAVSCAGLICWMRERFNPRWLLLAAIPVLYSAAGTVACAARMPPGITTQFDASAQVDMGEIQELRDFLAAQGETRGYTNYWVAYPLAFLSNEDLIFVPRLPYHLDLRYTSRDDRYPPFDDQVKKSPRIAYITTRNPALDKSLLDALADHAISYEQIQIGDFRVYFNLSKNYSPEDLGLPWTTMSE
jgi:hypothetical protein